MIKLYHEANKISVDLKGREVSIIYISYSGTLDGISLMGNSWDIYNNNNRILFVSKGNNIPTDLLSYSGKISIKGGYIANKEFNKESLRIIVSGIDYWDKHRVSFSDSTFFYEMLNQKHIKIKRNKSKIVTENLFTDGGEFYIPSTPPQDYQGDYHKHGNGDIMTGAYHGLNSQSIYSKGKKELYNKTKKLGMTKEQQYNGMKQILKYPLRKRFESSIKQSIQNINKLGISRDRFTDLTARGNKISGTRIGYTGAGTK